jgi:Phage integrase family
VRRLKCKLTGKATKTVNNILTVLNVMLKKAVEWDVIERVPWTITLLRVSKSSTPFYDFEEFERMVAAARATDPRAYLLVLMAGEAGLRLGEMVAPEWSDIDFVKRQVCVQRSAWKGQIASPKGGRLRYIPLTMRTRGGPAGSSSPPWAVGVVPGRWFSADRRPGAGVRQATGAEGRRVQQRAAHAAPHVLLAPGDAWRAGSRNSGAGRAPEPDHDAAVHAPQSRGARQRDPAARPARVRKIPWRHSGDRRS